MSIQNSTAETQSSRYSANQPRSVSEHAKIRWLQRSGDVGIAVRQAWVEGYYVGCDHVHGKTRFHPPSQTVLVERDNEIITVLETANMSYTADHLVNCGECGLEYQPARSERSCPWCAGEQTEGKK